MDKCLRCGHTGSPENHLSDHHVYPTRWRVKGHFDDVGHDERNRTVRLCFRDCHRAIERLIAQYEGKPAKALHWTFYAKIARDFVRYMTPAA